MRSIKFAGLGCTFPRLHCDCAGCCERRAADRQLLNPRYIGIVRRTPVYGWAIPNRLYGATINNEGDVI